MYYKFSTKKQKQRTNNRKEAVIYFFLINKYLREGRFDKSTKGCGTKLKQAQKKKRKSILKYNFSYLQNRLWKKWSWCICTQRVECWCHKKKTQALELVGADIVDGTVAHTSDIHERACTKKKTFQHLFFFRKTEDHEQREVFVTRHCQNFLYKTSGSLLCLHQTRNKHNVFKNVSTLVTQNPHAFSQKLPSI